MSTSPAPVPAQPPANQPMVGLNLTPGIQWRQFFTTLRNWLVNIVNNIPVFTTTVNGLVPAPGTVNGYFLRDDGTWDEAGESGTVTSVGLEDESTTPIYTVSNSPITSSGDLELTLKTQDANLVFAGPSSGGAAEPSFRALVAGDIPSLSYVESVSGTSGQISSSGGENPVLALVDTAVTAGSYTNADITVDAYGRITAASDGDSGTVTSVGLSMPGIFSVADSPVTESGTIEVTLETESANLVWAGPSSGSAAAPTFRSLVTADFPASGVTAGSYTLSGITVDSTGRITAASSGSVTVPSGANPSASVGLSAVDGSSTSFMRADGAPALSQSISPTWTGVHTFSTSTSGDISVTITGNEKTALAVESAANHYGISITGSDTTGESYGLQIQAGTNSVDAAMYFENMSGNTLLTIYGDGHGNLGSNGTTEVFTWTSAGAVTLSNDLSVNGNAVPSQSTGWGTPTGGSVQSDYSGSSATLAETSAAVAELISILKAIGFLGS